MKFTCLAPNGSVALYLLLLVLRLTDSHNQVQDKEFLLLSNNESICKNALCYGPVLHVKAMPPLFGSFSLLTPFGLPLRISYSWPNLVLAYPIFPSWPVEAPNVYSHRAVHSKIAGRAPKTFSALRCHNRQPTSMPREDARQLETGPKKGDTY
jgi:hypothetical protein